MRRAVATVVLSAITILAGLAASGSAQTVRTQVTNRDVARPYLPATVCGFRVDVRVVENHEFRSTMRVGPPAPAGTIVTRTAGKAVLRFVNHATGKAINRTLSGLSRETDYPNGTGTLVETGRSWNTLGPLSQAALDKTEPHLIFTTGRIKITFATTPTGVRYATSISRPRHQTDGCARLAGQPNGRPPSGGAPLPNSPNRDATAPSLDRRPSRSMGGYPSG